MIDMEQNYMRGDATRMETYIDLCAVVYEFKHCKGVFARRKLNMEAIRSMHDFYNLRDDTRYNATANSSNKIKILEQEATIDDCEQSLQTISPILRLEGTDTQGINQKTHLMSEQNQLSPDWIARATARHSLGNILPMPPPVMRALVCEAITMGASKSVIKAMLDAILSRHWDAGLPSPLAGNMTYSQLFNCVGRLLEKQQKHKFPITRQMVCDAFRLRPTTPSQFRNKMILVVGTVGIMRHGEIAAA
jgi:hypothetical protein